MPQSRGERQKDTTTVGLVQVLAGNLPEQSNDKIEIACVDELIHYPKLRKVRNFKEICYISEEIYTNIYISNADRTVSVFCVSSVQC